MLDNCLNKVQANANMSDERANEFSRWAMPPNSSKWWCKLYLEELENSQLSVLIHQNTHTPADLTVGSGKAGDAQTEKTTDSYKQASVR